MAKLICVKNFTNTIIGDIIADIEKGVTYEGSFDNDNDSWYLHNRSYPQILFFELEYFMYLSEFRELRLNKILNDD
jgi:hypothetical protein